MESSKEQNSIFDIKISTVAPGFVSRPNEDQELSGMDLAMKLHYLRFVYYFRAPAFDRLTILNIKETMFNWLSHAYIPCGRLRRADSDSRRPYIKCNDSGVRTIEARCHMTLDEWLESKNDSRHKLLVPNHVLGPDLAFSPLVMIQLTKFKCGSTAVGMGWSHVLGDAFSAFVFIRLWSQAIAGQYPAQPLSMARQPTQTIDNPGPKPGPDPVVIKRVGPVGDLWSTSNNSKMETFSFYISKTELTQLQAKICQAEPGQQVPLFECLCVAIWQCVAKGRRRPGPEIVTICKSDVKNRAKGTITNKSQIISSVKTDESVADYDPMELGLLIMKAAVDERMKIEEAMETTDGGELPDFLIYGANLTFVDLSDASFYEMDVRGQKPVYVNCGIDNIGEEGVVVVLPAPKDCSDGRIVSITIQENQAVELKSTLKQDWCIA